MFFFNRIYWNSCCDWSFLELDWGGWGWYKNHPVFEERKKIGRAIKDIKESVESWNHVKPTVTPWLHVEMVEK